MAPSRPSKRLAESSRSSRAPSNLLVFAGLLGIYGNVFLLMQRGAGPCAIPVTSSLGTIPAVSSAIASVNETRIADQRMIPLVANQTRSEHFAKSDSAAAAESRARDVTQMLVAKPRSLNDEISYLTFTNKDIDLGDTFAASWWQSIDSFLEVKNLNEELRDLESACFQQFAHRMHRARMTLDFTDLGVEHLSKWWKAVRRDFAWKFSPSRLATVLAVMHSYIERQITGGQLATIHDTIAVIPFTDAAKDPDSLTIVVLAATIASMWSAGFGRIVVVGASPQTDEEQVKAAFAMLFEYIDGRKVESTTVELKGTELGYVQGHNTSSVHTPVNIPRAALMGLRQAMEGGFGSGTAAERAWLGVKPQRWKYVFFTEQDNLLVTKKHIIPKLLKDMNAGLVMAPHRLQPIPHAYDFPHAPTKMFMLPAVEPYNQVTELNSDNGVCCDSGQARLHMEKQEKDVNGCWNTVWWQCALGKYYEESSTIKDHEGLILNYQLMNLTQGSGLVLIAGNHPGRKCYPNAQGGSC